MKNNSYLQDERSFQENVGDIAKQKLLNRLFNNGLQNPMKSIQRNAEKHQAKPLIAKVVVQNWQNQAATTQHNSFSTKPPIQQQQQQLDESSLRLPQIDQSKIPKTSELLFINPQHRRSKSFKRQAFGPRDNSLCKEALNKTVIEKEASQDKKEKALDYSLMLPQSKQYLQKAFQRKIYQHINKESPEPHQQPRETSVGVKQQRVVDKIEHLVDKQPVRPQDIQKLVSEAPSFAYEPVLNVMDALTGRFQELEKYAKKPKQGKFKRNSKIMRLKNESFQILNESLLKESEPQEAQNLLKNDSDEEKEDNTTSKVRNVDRFIQMIKLGDVSQLEFIYLVKKNSNSNNLYNMKLVNFHYLTENGIHNYYTLSVQGVTRHENNMPIEFVTLDEWLKEREQFNAIKNLSFFRKFRKWKTLKKWQKILFFKRQYLISDLLTKRLYILDPNFQKMILSHRNICLEIEKLKFIDISNQKDTLRLDQFTESQHNLRSEVVKVLKEQSKKLHKNSSEGLIKIVHNLKLNIDKELRDDEEVGEGQDSQNENFSRLQKDEKKQVLENLGLPLNMGYGNRQSMRQQFIRFLRFAYLLDFLTIQSLGSVYVNSAQNFVEILGQMSQKGEDLNIEEIFCQSQEANQRIKDTEEPLFNLDLVFDAKVAEEDYDVEEESQTVQEIAQNIQYFDLNLYTESSKPIVQEVDDPNEENIEIDPVEVEKQRQKLIYEDQELPDEVRKVRTVTNIHKCWINVQPHKQDFIDSIKNIFSQGVDCIQVIERWSKNKSLLDYVKALEEWDEIIGETWNEPENMYLNPLNWIREQPIYKEVNLSIEEIVDQSFKQVSRLVVQFKPVFNLFWRELHSDIEILRNEDLHNQLKMYQYSLQFYQNNNQIFQEKLIGSVSVGLFFIDCQKVPHSILPLHQSKVKQLSIVLCETFRQRALKVRDWLQKSSRSLSGMVMKIEEFVEQKNCLDIINKEFPAKKEEIYLLESLQNLLVEKNIEQFDKEDKELQIDITKLIFTLNSCMDQAEQNTSKNIDRFKKYLSDFIKQLKEESLLLLEQSTKEQFLILNNRNNKTLEELEQLNEKLNVAEQKMKKYQDYEEILQVQEVASYDQLLQAREELNLRHSLWKGIKEFRIYNEEWSGLPFGQINAKEIAQITESYVKICNRCKKNLPDNPVLQELCRLVFEVKNTMPVVIALRSEYLRDDHWFEIKSIIKNDFQISNPTFTLSRLLELNVSVFQEELIEIAQKAVQEFSIEQQLNQVKKIWEQTSLKFKEYKDSQELKVLSEIDKLRLQFDESLATMNNLLGSRYIKPLRKQAESFFKDIMYLSEVIDKWVEYQRKWMYLENIFNAQDIKKNLPQESQKFENCDRFLKVLMKKSSQTPKILLLLKILSLLDNLNKNFAVLEEIEKKLEDYLELKRQFFPRFYFISNDELLEILSKASKLQAVEPLIGKCFEGLYRLYMGPDKTTANSIGIQGIISHEGEKVEFSKQVQCKNNIEFWLDILQNEMFSTIKKLVKNGFNDACTLSKPDFIRKSLGQVVSTNTQIIWCQLVEQAITDIQERPNSLQECLDSIILQLQELTQLVRGQLTSLERKVIVGQITTEVHNRDIVDKLVQQEVCQTEDFLWQQQLRYYQDAENEDQCVIKQVTAKLNYGYEYLGATSRLVITPLTDRCWITISSALENKLGASPAGPAGTGKTESTKDLAKGLGQLCIVFNCSDQITASMMNKLFKGLAQQGAWSCLDEFNRIDIEVLSVIAQQLLVVRMALLQNSETFVFDGSEIKLKTTYGVFITMNPGYAGRTELPDNLKSLFRPVSMMMPDYAMIAEIMLFAEGFENASVLSKKMVQLYKLSSEQLSQQDHYDFGMRAVKSLLVMAGSLKRAEAKLSEDVVLIRAMRDANVPKFLKADIPLFQALIGDLFPSVEIPEVQYPQLEQAIAAILEQSKFQKASSFIQKIIQFFDTLNVRFGVMLVGQAGTGKTECYRTLARTMRLLRQKEDPDPRFQMVDYHVLNPKSIYMGELYGEVDSFTQEWVDGLASFIIRSVNTTGFVEQGWDPNHKDWVIFDGPVDALWIENMNTVLDDNMTLCLANSERIKLRGELRMLFEVQDLAVASPATVSRCGMVYLSPEDLGWESYVKTWFEVRLGESEHAITTLNQQQNQYLITYFVNVFNAFTQKTHSFFEPFATTLIQRAKNVCNFMEIYLQQLKVEQNEDETLKKLNYFFCFCFIWGVGSSFDESHYQALDIVFKDLFQNIRFPRAETIFDYFVEPETQKQFLTWETKIEVFTYDKDLSYFNLLVPTIDTTKYSLILENNLKKQKPCLVTGQTGVGKSVIVQNLLKKSQEKSKMFPIMLNFSAQTSSKQTQLAIESKLYKKTQKILGAKPNEQNIIFIDDINMPSLESYGAQPCIELLRQIIEQKGVYDRIKPTWKEIQDTTFVIAGGPPGGGKNNLCQRFLRNFNVFFIPQPSDSILQTIFGQMLKGFFGSYNFSDAAKRCCEPLVQSTIEVYRLVVTELLPIPSKFHYTFNLRDVSKVFQGIVSIKPQACNTLEAFCKLWVHEVARIFQDRLSTDEDRVWFKELIYKKCEANLTISLNVEETITFSDILKLDLGLVQYEEIVDQKKLLKILEEKQEDFNSSSQTEKLDLVFFELAIDHILRIARILRQPRGNGMLIGVSGSGKQSLSKLASSIMKSQVFQIELVKSYNQASFREDLKKILFKSGVENQQISFIFTDFQIAYEGFLEDINNLLNTGEIPNLYEKKEEIDELYSNLRILASKLKITDSSSERLWSLYIEKVRENLHILLCMSPVGESLRIRCRKFPSLVNCCTLDWFPPWPEDALQQVAARFLNEIHFSNNSIRDKLSEMCMLVNVEVVQLCDKFLRELKRQVYTTPKSYLDQIKLYQNLLNEERTQIMTQSKKLVDGLEKLYQTNQIVATLQKQMIELQPQLQIQSEKTNQFLELINVEKQEAAVVENKVQQESSVVNQQAEEVRVLTEEAEKQLAAALPDLQKAEDALNTINKKDISDIKSYTRPPAQVILVMEVVCTLLAEKTDWESAKKVLMDLGFIERLKTFDKNTIPDKITQKLKSYIMRADFEPVQIGTVSGACKSLCLWCIAIEKYSKIHKEVAPKQRNVEEMNLILKQKNDELKKKLAELQKVQDKVAKLEKECEDTQYLKTKLENDLMKTKKRLIAAEKLTLLLADEGVRWKQQIEQIDEQLEELIGNVFLAASTISYLGPFTRLYREEIERSWVKNMKEKKLPFSENYTFSSTLESPIKIRDWIMEGLPSDQFSIDNGVITKHSQKWPLLIDPQGEALKWLKNSEAKNNLKVMRFTGTHYLMTLQQCISNGYSALIEEVQSQLEPAIDSILQKQFYVIDGRKLIRLGDKQIDYDQHFLLFLTSKLANPNYLPEVFIKVTVINFSITFEGLQDQLLGEVIKHERPDIEKQKDETVVSIANGQKSLKQAQDKILEMLAESKGNILDDEELISTLELSKKQSAQIEINLVETQKLEITINEKRSFYVSVSVRGTVLYFIIQYLSLIDPMYQYSLHYFKQLFKTAMDFQSQEEEGEVRLKDLIHSITKSIYVNVSRGLFEQHKKLFSFLIVTSIQRMNDDISPALWNLLIRGPATTTSDAKQPSKTTDKLPQQQTLQTEKKQSKKETTQSTANSSQNPLKEKLTDQEWQQLLAYSLSIKDLKDIANHIKIALAAWVDYINCSNLYATPMPKPYEGLESDRFLKLIMVKILKPEKLMQAFSFYIEEKLGEFYNSSPTTTMEEIYQASNHKTPITFILSQGADPTNMILKLKNDKNVQINVISLGQGQGRKAEHLIEQSLKSGDWVLLQNCHLAKSWVSSLERIIESFQQEAVDSEEKTNPDFRLFLTSMPASYFPVSILQNSIKLTTEPPRGLKANLKRSLQDQSDSIILTLKTEEQKEAYQKLFFNLAFFHALIQERRKFGALGFNIKYDFNDSDFEIANSTLKMFLLALLDVNLAEKVPWDAILYMVGNINYGGRVTDDFDRVCLFRILQKFVSLDALTSNYKYSKSGIYFCPQPENSFLIFKSYIETLPNFDEPEIFGLHENANIVYQKQEVQQLLETILSVQPRQSSDSSAKSTDQIVIEMSQQFQHSLPELISIEGGSQTHFVVTDLGAYKSLTTVLLQEVEKFNKLLTICKQSLINLEKAIKGFMVMSQDLDQMYLSFLNNQMPQIWTKVSYSSLKPLASWFQDLIQRVAFMKDWLFNTTPNAFWLSGFFFPQGFLTGVLQTHSRNYKIPIDTLSFKFQVIDTEKEKIAAPKDGVYIYGLFLDGGKYETHIDSLIDQSIGVLYYSMPILYFNPTENQHIIKSQKHYICPLYKTSNRVGVLSTTGQSTNYIISVNLNSKNEPPEFWSLRGTALLCQLND